MKVGAFPEERITRDRRGQKYRHTFMRLPNPPDENTPPNGLLLRGKQRLLRPHWGKPVKDSLNSVFIDAVIESVSNTKVSYLRTIFNITSKYSWYSSGQRNSGGIS